MKSLVLSLILVTHFTSAYADEALPLGELVQAVDVSGQADSPVPEQLKLLGRGFRKKGSSESVVLACENTDCSAYRFVYYPDQNSAQWIGPSFKKVVASADPKVQAEYDRLRMKKFLLSNQDDSSMVATSGIYSKIAAPIVLIGGTCAINSFGATSWMVLVPMVGVTAAFIGAGFFVLSMINSTDSALVGRNSANEVFTSSHDQNGWGWSARPTNLKAKKFDALLENIQRTGDVTRTAATQRKIDRALKKMEELKSEGAQQ